MSRPPTHDRPPWHPPHTAREYFCIIPLFYGYVCYTAALVWFLSVTDKRRILAIKIPFPHEFLPTTINTFSVLPRLIASAQCACPGCLRDNRVKRFEKKLKPNSFKYGQNSHKAKKAVDKPTGFFGLQEFQGLNPHKF